MKYIFPIVIILVSCHKERKQEPFSFIQVSEHEWSTFEGRIITPEGYPVDVELSLREGAPGVSSDYQLNELEYRGNVNLMLQTRGKYDVSYGLPDGEFGIELLVTSTGQKISSAPSSTGCSRSGNL